MRRITLLSCAMVGALSITGPASADTLRVGPGQDFATPCAAIAVAAPGDTIEIDSAGNYDGDVCRWATNQLILRGVGEDRAHIDAAGQSAQGKAIWVIAGDDTTVENIEFTGATVPDHNGAGIRQEGYNLTVRNCYFHDNEEGILTGEGASSTILIEFSEFGYNGYGDGFSHNLYIGHVGRFIFRYNYSHHSIEGHLVKSRAAENYILYNRLTDEETGTGSYEIDIPNGGKSYVIGNLIEQGPQTHNSTIVTYLEEGVDPRNPSRELFVVNNTFVNDRLFGDNLFIYLAGTAAPAVITNSIFMGPGRLTNQSDAILSHNFVGDPLLVDPLVYDYHLQEGSPAIDAGINPGFDGDVSLAAAYQYVHPACAEERMLVGDFDIGAYEFGGETGVAPPLAPARCLQDSQARFPLSSQSTFMLR